MIIVIILVYLFAFFNSNGQDASKRASPILLHYADEMQGANTDSTSFRKCIGNVKLSQGNVNVNCDRADHFITENRAVLIGNVVITQDTLILKAPRVNYDGNNGIADAYEGVEIIIGKTALIADNGVYSTKTYIAEFNKNVVIDDDSAKIFADKIIYNRRTKDSKAFGNVLVKGKYTNIILIGDTVLYEPRRNYTVVTGKPILIQIDTVFEESDHKAEIKSQDEITNNIEINEESSEKKSKGIKLDTMTIVSDTMEAVRGIYEETYYFKNMVEIIKGNVVGKATNAEYNKNRELIKLMGMPIVWYDSTQLYADTTIIVLQNEKLKEISAIGTAFAGSKDDTASLNLINQLSGNNINIKFSSDTIHKIECIGNAKSLYFMSDSAGTEGAARNSSDTIFVHFINGDADEIFWISGVEGEFLPVNILNQNPKNYFLPSFRWNNNKPARKVIFHKNLNDK